MTLRISVLMVALGLMTHAYAPPPGGDETVTVSANPVVQGLEWDATADGNGNFQARIAIDTSYTENFNQAIDGGCTAERLEGEADASHSDYPRLEDNDAQPFDVDVTLVVSRPGKYRVTCLVDYIAPQEPEEPPIIDVYVVGGPLAHSVTWEQNGPTDQERIPQGFDSITSREIDRSIGGAGSYSGPFILQDLGFKLKSDGTWDNRPGLVFVEGQGLKALYQEPSIGKVEPAYSQSSGTQLSFSGWQHRQVSDTAFVYGLGSTPSGEIEIRADFLFEVNNVLYSYACTSDAGYRELMPGIIIFDPAYFSFTSFYPYDLKTLGTGGVVTVDGPDQYSHSVNYRRQLLDMLGRGAPWFFVTERFKDFHMLLEQWKGNVELEIGFNNWESLEVKVGSFESYWTAMNLLGYEKTGELNNFDHVELRMPFEWSSTVLPMSAKPLEHKQNIFAGTRVTALSSWGIMVKQYLVEKWTDYIEVNER
ncbi:MAG: hypothetical protein ACOCX1_00895 [Fimbriimonadaceae bacterium]